MLAPLTAVAQTKPQANPHSLSSSDRQQIYVGDDNALTLEVSAENRGEGAYEAELHVYPPPQADFTGVVRSQVGGSGRGSAQLKVSLPSEDMMVSLRLSAGCPAPTRRRTRPRWWCVTWGTP